MYKMSSITKETWEKSGERVKKKWVKELWLKMSDMQKKLDHTNVTKLIKRELKGIYGKKNKDITNQEKEKDKTFFMAILSFTLLKILP